MKIGPDSPASIVVPQVKNEWFYRIFCFLGRRVLGIASKSVELNIERAHQEGGILLASNHAGPYDVPCLMKVCTRPIDFISITRFGNRPFVGWFFRNLNAVFLKRDGGLADSATFREVIKRLRRGRLVGIFPEAEMRKPGTEASQSGHFYSGFGKLAVLGRVPILPAAVLDTNNLTHFTGWLPWPKTSWGVIVGEPIPIPTDCNSQEAAEKMEQAWLEAVTELEKELRIALDERFGKDRKFV